MRYWVSGFAAAILLSTGGANVAAEPDVVAGKTVYKKCKACHVIDKEKNRVGPHLVGIVGRKAGSIEGYKYSKALKKMAGEWRKVKEKAQKAA